MAYQFPDTVHVVIFLREGVNTVEPEEREISARSPSELQGKIQAAQRLGQQYCGFKMINGQMVPQNQQGQQLANQYMKNWANYLNQRRRGIVNPQPPQQQHAVQHIQQAAPVDSGFLPQQSIESDPLTGVQQMQSAAIDPNTGLPIGPAPEVRVLSEVIVEGRKIRSWSNGTIEVEEWVELSDDDISNSLRIEPAKDPSTGKVIKNKYRVHQKKWVKKTNNV